MKKVVIAVLVVLLAGSIAGNYLEYERYSSSRPIVRIGGTAITKKDYQDQLDYDMGKKVLTDLTIERLVAWGATKAGVMPTDKDVDERITEIERRKPAMLADAKRDPAKMFELRRQLKTEIGLENLRMKDITVTDADVAAYYEKHKETLGVPTQAKTTMVVNRNAVDAATSAELLRQNMSRTVIAHQPRTRVVGVGGFMMPEHIPDELAIRLGRAVAGTKVGGVATVPAGQAFIVIRVNSRSPADIPPLEAIKPIVARMARLDKSRSPADTLTQLYHDANVTVEVDKYAPYLSEIASRAAKLDGAKPTADASH